MEFTNHDAGEMLDAIADYLGVERYYLEQALIEIVKYKTRGQ